MPGIRIEPIPKNFASLSRVFDPKIWEREWFIVLEKEIREERNIWDQFTASWRSKPTWKRKKNRGRTAKDMFVQDTSRSTPFVFVEGGTSRMPKAYVHKFIPKTFPSGRSSWSGRRGYVVVHKGMKKGIEARNVRETIKKDRNVQFLIELRKASGRATRRALGRYRR